MSRRRRVVIEYRVAVTWKSIGEWQLANRAARIALDNLRAMRNRMGRRVYSLDASLHLLEGSPFSGRGYVSISVDAPVDREADVSRIVETVAEKVADVMREDYGLHVSSPIRAEEHGGPGGIRTPDHRVSPSHPPGAREPERGSGARCSPRLSYGPTPSEPTM